MTKKSAPVSATPPCPSGGPHLWLCEPAIVDGVRGTQETCQRPNCGAVRFWATQQAGKGWYGAQHRGKPPASAS